jgi:uncharacterized membrane protein YhiD involved in acid resistance
MSGRFWKWFHLAGVFAMIILWVTAGLLGWLESVVFVSHVSMAALVLAELSSWQGSRTEQKQDKQIEENDNRDDQQDDTLNINTDTEENRE